MPVPRGRAAARRFVLRGKSGRYSLSRTVSDVRRARRRAPSAAEWALLGEVAFEAIHDLSDPLTVIAGLARLLLERRGEPPTRAELRAIASRANQACQIIHRTFGHREARPVGDINHALMRAVRAAGFTPSQVETRLASHLPLAAIFPDEMESVLVNVLLNARRAMKGLACQKVALGTCRKGGKIVVTIADSGPGIPREQLAKIFEPFYTATRDVESHGLGLFIVRRMLQRRGGTIQAASRGRGTVFSIEVPVARRTGTGAKGHGR